MHVPLHRSKEISAQFSSQRIVVIGDVMLDHLIVGDARRISPEAPIPVVSFITESYSPGGAANVAHNLAALGCTADLLGVVGDDAGAEQFCAALAAHRIDPSGIVREAGRPTTVKMRVTAQRHQVVRLDRETTHPLSPASAAALLTALRARLPGAAAVIVADYAKGVIDQPLLDAVLAETRCLNLPVCIDPKPSRHLALRGCTVLTPNRKETFELAGLSDSGASRDPLSDGALRRAIEIVREKHAPDLLLITLSEAGLLLVEKGQPPRHIPTFARQVFDVTGAGDTVISAFVLARAAGASTTEAAVIANHAAGIVVGKLGTAAVSCEELLHWLEHEQPA